MSNSETVKVCAVFKPQIVDDDYYSPRRGQSIIPEAPPNETLPAVDYLSAIMPGQKVEHIGRDTLLKIWEWGEPGSTSLFFQAVHGCFKNHHSLTLRPEVLAHLIVNEVATTVKMHPEDYRHLFTSPDEKERIDVIHDGLVLGDPESPWHEAIGYFDAPLRELVPAGIMEHLLPDFSTATPETQTASLVAFMAAASPFYDYHTHTLCGIPEIRLAGEPEDYKKLLSAASQLSEVFTGHLGKYFDHLLPVLGTLAEQAGGAEPDEAFWSSIYKFESHSGSDKFNGWITAFVNYVQTADTRAYRSNGKPGELVQKPDDVFDWTDMKGGWDMKGLSLGSVPSQVSVAPFTWHYYEKEIAMAFAGGVLGIENHDDSVMPMLSYAVLHAAE